jgi:hypothetical protein
MVPSLKAGGKALAFSMAVSIASHSHHLFASSLYGPDPTDWLNRIRTISVANDVGGWRFNSQGQVQPFEQTQRYLKRKIVDRFTIEMLRDYCFALGIDAFNAGFYGDQSLAYHIANKSITGGPRISIEQARTKVRTS